MSRHRRPEPEDDDVLPAPGPEPHPPTGAPAAPRVVVVPRPRPASEPVSPLGGEEQPGAVGIPPRPRHATVTARPAGPRVGPPAGPPAPSANPQEPPADEEPATDDGPARVRRDWADAPGGFTRSGWEGPRTVPFTAPRGVTARPAPPEAWGPWPPPDLIGRAPAVPVAHHPAPPPSAPPVVASGTWPAPARVPRGPGARVIGMIAVLVVLLIGLGVGLARPDLLRLSASPLFAAGGKAAPGAGGGAGSADVTPAAGSTGTGEAGPTDPTAELRRLAQSDAASLGAIADTWVPQLASKRPGTVAAGRTWDAAAILAEHQQLRARYPQARLLWSGDWSVFGGDDYWVTVLASPVASPAGADGWCDGQGLGADDCFATWLSHRGGSAGTAVHR